MAASRKIVRENDIYRFFLKLFPSWDNYDTMA